MCTDVDAAMLSRHRHGDSSPSLAREIGRSNGYVAYPSLRGGGDVAAGVAPAVLQVQSDIGGSRVGPHQPRTLDRKTFRCTRDYRQPRQGGASHPRRPQRIHEQMEFEFVLDERLHASPRPTESAVPQTYFDRVARTEVAVDDVDQQRLLERALTAFDVVPNLQLPRRGR